MAQTSVLSSIQRSGTFPITQNISAPNNCGTLALILNQNWTEQMIHELPTINVAVYVDTDIKLLSIDIDMTTVCSDKTDLEPIKPYSIPLFDLPESFDFVVTPIFDNNALASHNAQIDSGDVNVFNTSDTGIVDTNITDYSSEYWTTRTDSFDIDIVFDDTKITSGGGSGGGGGQTITVDTQVIQGSTNPVQNGAIYDFVNSSVSTSTAYFIGTFNSLAELEAYSGTVTNNDYAFVISTDSNGNTVYNRYKYNSETETWNFEYALNNSSFTAAEWATIQSGLTANDRTNYNNHLADTNNPHSVTKTQVGLGNVDNTSDADKPVSTAMQTALDAKQNNLTFDGTYDASTNKAATVSTVTNAINNLDVSSVGGSGKYISAISETDGKISPTVETMDTVPTSGSTKAVTSGGVQAPLAEVIDNGAKNVLDVTSQTTTISGVTFTVNGDKTITVTGTAGATNIAFNLYTGSNYIQNDFSTMIISDGSPESTSDVYLYYAVSNNGSSAAAEYSLYGNTSKVIGTFPYVRFAILVKANTSIINPITIKPMICTKAAWDISHEYVPYGKTNAELTVAEDENRAALAEVIDGGAAGTKNHCTLASGSNNPSSDRWINIPVSDVGVGQWVMSFGTLTSTDKDDTLCQATCFNSSGKQVSNWVHFKREANTNKVFTTTDNVAYVRLYAATSYAASAGDIVTFTNAMLCRKVLYDVNPDYEPYAPAKTNVEITPALVELVDAGAKNLVDINSPKSLSRFTVSGGVLTSQTGDSKTNLTLIFKKLVGSSEVTIDSFGEITKSGVYSHTFKKSTENDTKFIVMHSGSTVDYKAYYDISALPLGNYVAEIYVDNYLKSEGGYTLQNLMICTAADWAISQKFVPYALPNPTLTPAVIKAVDEGAKNKLDANPNSDTGWVDINVEIPSGDYVLFFGNLTSTDTDATTCQLGLFNSDMQNILGSYPQLERGNNIVYQFTILEASKTLRVYASRNSSLGRGDTVTVTNAMICTAADWNVSQKYVPYALTNPELTSKLTADEAALAELVNSGGKNVLPIRFTTKTYKGIDIANNGDGTITLDKSNTAGTAGIGVADLSSDASQTSGGRLQIAEGTYVVSCDFVGSDTGVQLQVYKTNGTTNVSIYSGNSPDEFVYNDSSTYPYIVARLSIGATASFNNVTMKPMICTKAAWDISHKFVPYALPNPTLTPAVIKAVDEGAKNLLKNALAGTSSTKYAVTGTFDENGVGTISGTNNSTTNDSVFVIIESLSLPVGRYHASGCPAGGEVGVYRIDFVKSTGSVYRDIGNGVNFDITGNETIRAQFVVYRGKTAPTGQVRPMICTAADWAVSHKFVPYALPNPTLTPAVIKAVDEGEKNLCNWSASTSTISDVTFTINPDKTVSTSGTATGRSQKWLDFTVPTTLKAGRYVLSGCPTGGAQSETILYCLYVWDKTANARVCSNDTGDGIEFDWIPDASHSYSITVDVRSGTNASGLTFKPMICTAADWKVSQKYVPYCPSLQDLVVQKATNVVNGTTTLSGTGVSIALKGGNIYRLTANAKYKAANLSEIAIKYTISGTTYSVCSNSITPTSNTVYLTTTGLINPSSDVTVETYVKTETNGNVEILLLAEKIYAN